MSRYDTDYNVLDSAWALNKDTNEVVGLRIIYIDAQMYRPFIIELLRGDMENKTLRYSVTLERTHDAHDTYQMFESYKDMFFENTIPLDPKDHPFIAKFIREKESANKRYSPWNDWRYRYGMPPVLHTTSFLRYFGRNPLTSMLGWLLVIGLSIGGFVIWWG